MSWTKLCSLQETCSAPGGRDVTGKLVYCVDAAKTGCLTSFAGGLSVVVDIQAVCKSKVSALLPVLPLNPSVLALDLVAIACRLESRTGAKEHELYATAREL